MNLPSIRKATRVNQFQEKYVINKSMFIQKKVSADKYLKLSTLEKLKNASENVSVIKDHSDKPKKNSSVMRP